MQIVDLVESQISSLITNIYGEQYLYNANRNSFLNVCAETLFEKEFNSIFEEDYLYVIVGSDSALLAKFIHNKGVPTGTRYLFVETDKALDSINYHKLIDNLDSSIVFTNLRNLKNSLTDLNIESYCYINSLHILKAICVMQTGINEYSELDWKVREIILEIHNNQNMNLYSEIFIQRQMENICELQYPAKLIEGAYQNQTVIILAGGPSLTNILPWVKKNQERLVIFAVSRISKQLIQEKITPDFIFSVDPQKISFDVSQDILSFDDKPILINANHVYPGLLNQWHGFSLYLGNLLPWESPQNLDNIEIAAPTVTNNALTMAHHLGFTTILLAGVDLCYSATGITHAEGSYEQKAGPCYNPSSVKVENYAGEIRETTTAYYEALTTISKQARDRKEITHINLSINAAKADGIAYIPNTEIKLPNKKKISLESIKTLVNSVRKNPNKYNHYENILKELSTTKHQLIKIKDLSQRALLVNEKMYDANGMIGNYKDKIKLDIIEKTLSKKYKSYSLLIKNLGIRKFLRITTAHDDSRDIDAKKAQQIGKTYYDAYVDGANRFIAMIDKAINRTKSRQEEEKKEPNFPILFKQWDEDQSYRRAYLWRKNNPEIKLCDSIQEQFSLFANKFNKLINESSNSVSNFMESPQNRLNILKSKINLLFKHRRLNDLYNLQQSFMSDKLCEKNMDYLWLILAYIADTEENHIKALEYYHYIINASNNNHLEDALRRIASISINQKNIADGLLALKCLTQISPIYLPAYAECARLSGDIMLAIDSYNTYATIFPEDITIKLKLASLYLNHKVYKAAEIMVEHILEKSPNLKAAINLKQKIASKICQ